MTGTAAERLHAMGIELPEPPAPVASYVGFKVAERVVYVSGQLPFRDGAVAYKGRLGDGVSVEEGAAAARLCAVNVLAQARAAAGGDLERLACVRLGGFVASAPDFFDQPKVVNGASELIAEVLGEAGLHARAAVGVAALPLGVPVEVEGVFLLKG